MKNKIISALLSAIMLLSMNLSLPVSASFQMPTTEMKFLLDPTKVLDDNGELLDDVAWLFEVNPNHANAPFSLDQGRSVTMQFMDTPEQRFNEEGWFNRIRNRWTPTNTWNPNEGYQITYRKRIPIVWPVTESTIQAALDQATADGFVYSFNSNSPNWHATVDWSFNSAVLTLSRTVSTNIPVSINTMPNKEESIGLLKTYMPDNFEELLGREADFDDVVLHGPVTFRRYEFRFPNTSINIVCVEVMKIGDEYIVEASAEIGGFIGLFGIELLRDELQRILEGKDENKVQILPNILIPDDGLRTTKVLETYEQERTHITIKGVRHSISVTGLNLESMNLTNKDIEPLKYMVNLRVLKLDGGKITDISVLSGLTNLTDLYLDYNQISDISPLSGLTNLRWLSLWKNQISDLSPLSELTNLRSLWSAQNQITDVSPLSELTNLVDLDLSSNQITDVSSLSELTNLMELGLMKNPISDISSLSGMTEMRWLNLCNNQISDISPLSNMTEMLSMCLNNNQISDLAPLSNMTKIRWLELKDNQIDDISVLSNTVSLQYLFLQSNPLTIQQVNSLKFTLRNCQISF